MMRFLASAAAVALLSGSALAADVPEYTPPPEMMAPTPIAYNWSGFYIGLHAGYAWADDDGIVAGGQLGYNAMFGSFLVGLEADAGWADLDEADSLASVRARAGVAFDRFLAYGTAGWGFADFDENGWVAGGGVEFGLTPNVTLGAEYLHYDLDDDSADVVRARVNVKFGALGG